MEQVKTVSAAPKVSPIKAIRTTDAKQLHRFLSEKYGLIVHDRGIKTLNIYEEHGETNIGLNNFTPQDLKAIISNKETREMLTVYINENHRFSTSPKIKKELYIWTADGEMNQGYSKENFRSEMFKEKIDICYKTGVVTVRKAYPKVLQNNNADMDKLIKCIVGEKMFGTVKNLLAQMLCEKRINKSGRASLIMWGARGSGKGFFVEQIMNHLLHGMGTPLPINYQSFNGFMDNKLIYLDENESKDLDMQSISKLAKRISGGVRETINKKNAQTYSIKMYGYFAVMSNSKPINITEKPVRDKDNQWIIIKTEKALNDNDVFNNIRETHGYDLTAFLKRSVGAYIKDELVPLYLKNVKKYKDYRYGFPIPITEELQELCYLSESNYETEAIDMMEYMVNISPLKFDSVIAQDADYASLSEDFRSFKEHFFLTSLLSGFFKRKFRVTNKQLKSVVVKYKWGTGRSECKRIKGVVVRGLFLDKETLLGFFNPPETVDLEEDDFDYELI